MKQVKLLHRSKVVERVYNIARLYNRVYYIDLGS